MRRVLFGLVILFGAGGAYAQQATPTPVACAPSSAQKVNVLLMDNLACRAIVMADTKGKCAIYILNNVPILDCDGTRYSIDTTTLP